MPRSPLQIVGIEDAVARELRVAKLAALTQQGIDQRRFAVVDVCNDGDIADIGASHGISELVCRKRLTGRVAGEARGTRAGRTLSGGPGRQLSRVNPSPLQKEPQPAVRQSAV